MREGREDWKDSQRPESLSSSASSGWRMRSAAFHVDAQLFALLLTQNTTFMTLHNGGGDVVKQYKLHYSTD